MRYEINITGETAEDNINFKKEEEKIDYFQFKLDSDDDTLERDRDARVKFTIRGIIDEVTRINTNKLANWSIKKDKFFRTIEATLYDNDGNLYRVYKFDKMFVIDYSEEFGNNLGTFELLIAQSPNNKTHDITLGNE